MVSRLKRIVFIVNPISGVGRQKKILGLIDAVVDRTIYAIDVKYTNAQGHATILSREAAEGGADVVVAVGGDGTVNEVAAGLAGTEAALGIIPAGSGNGLARHLGIPVNLTKSLHLLNKARIATIDTATINGEFFVNLAGIGFDAMVAKKFAVAGTRGFSTYFRIIAGSYPKYKPKHYILEIDGKIYKRQALLISFANSSQFGNNTSIEPTASVSDGLIDVCIVGKIPLWKTFLFAPLLMIRLFHHTRYIEIIKAKEVVIKRKKGKNVHLDGDPKEMGKTLVVKINPLSLKVLTP